MRRLQGRICGIVLAAEEKEAMEEIDTAADFGADLVELRIDSILEADLERLINYRDIPKIVTDLAGKRGDRERVRSLSRAVTLQPEYVDINLDFQSGEDVRDDLISHAKDNSVQVICSFHDHEKTPSEREMLSIISGMREIGADIAKIAVEARSMHDCRRVLNLILESKEVDLPIIAFSTGELGSFTRVFSPIFGGFLTYTPINPEKVVAGQIALREMIDIYSKMRLI